MLAEDVIFIHVGFCWISFLSQYVSNGKLIENIAMILG